MYKIRDKSNQLKNCIYLKKKLKKSTGSLIPSKQREPFKISQVPYHKNEL